MNDKLLTSITPLPFAGKTKRAPLIVAGPCSAESRQQVLRTARELKATGSVAVFRAGLWKPRTRPGTFEGVGFKGLEWLMLAKQETGMPVATEVATREHVAAALDAGIDVLWVAPARVPTPLPCKRLPMPSRDTRVLPCW